MGREETEKISLVMQCHYSHTVLSAYTVVDTSRYFKGLSKRTDFSECYVLQCRPILLRSYKDGRFMELETSTSVPCTRVRKEKCALSLMEFQTSWRIQHGWCNKKRSVYRTQATDLPLHQRGHNIAVILTT